MNEEFLERSGNKLNSFILNNFNLDSERSINDVYKKGKILNNLNY